MAQTFFVILSVIILLVWQLSARNWTWICLIASPIHLMCVSASMVLFTMKS